MAHHMQIIGEATYLEQKGVDIKIAIDMMGKAQRNEYDCAVVVSGDGDFVGLEQLLKEAGRHVINAHCPPNPRQRNHPYRLLRQARDGCTVVDKAFPDGCSLAQDSGFQ